MTTHCIHPNVDERFFDKLQGRMVIQSSQAVASKAGIDRDLFEDIGTTDEVLGAIAILWAMKREIEELERNDPVKKAEATARKAKAAYDKALLNAERIATEALAETAAQ